MQKGAVSDGDLPQQPFEWPIKMKFSTTRNLFVLETCLLWIPTSLTWGQSCYADQVPLPAIGSRVGLTSRARCPFQLNDIKVDLDAPDFGDSDADILPLLAQIDF